MLPSSTYRLEKPYSLNLVTFTNAAFAIRHDCSSQGGYITALAHKSVLDGASSKFHVLDWRSYRLPRVARSTLGESQAASEAVDAHLFTATFLSAMSKPDYTPSTARTLTPGLTPAWSWLTRRPSSTCYIGTNFRLQLAPIRGRTWRPSSSRTSYAKPEDMSAGFLTNDKYADSLMKIAAPQLLADRLRMHQFSLINEEDYQASRKKTAVERRASGYQFPRPRPSTTSSTFGMCFAATCLRDLIPYNQHVSF